MSTNPNPSLAHRAFLSNRFSPRPTNHCYLTVWFCMSCLRFSFPNRYEEIFAHDPRAKEVLMRMSAHTRRLRALNHALEDQIHRKQRRREQTGSSRQIRHKALTAGSSSSSPGVVLKMHLLPPHHHYEQQQQQQQQQQPQRPSQRQHQRPPQPQPVSYTHLTLPTIYSV